MSTSQHPGDDPRSARGERVDNGLCDPAGTSDARRMHKPRVDHRARAEDIRWFAATGESLSGAARRLGISTDGVEAWCRKHGYTSELAALRSREPIDLAGTLSMRGRAGAMARWSA